LLRQIDAGGAPEKVGAIIIEELEAHCSGRRACG
jgi:hypothetical protein